MKTWMAICAYILIAPLLGGLLAGIDRRITARMQGRFGPPILQPFYDVLKLFEKESVAVNHIQNFYILFFLIGVIFTGCLFFSGSDLLMVIFALTLANIFLILGAYSANSPYSSIGAMRELMQMMAYEPMVFLVAIGFYMVTGSFSISDLVRSDKLLFPYLPGIFAGFLYILTIKMRKSPFDLSMSHHAHQELVKGITTEFSGSTLALIEIAHWYENLFLLGFVFLFFTWASPWGPVVGIMTCLAVYFLEILIDNSFARAKWQYVLSSSWAVAATLGFANVVILQLLQK
jgi:formate hydrogenlyase subunit 4